MSNTPNGHPPEQVLVIPAALAEALANYKVFGPTSPILEKLILDNHSFREREEAETNFNFKQVIPYVLVCHTEACKITEKFSLSVPAMYLLSQRTSQQQEKRLHSKYSIGQGGHINRLDFDGSHGPIINGLMREVFEEFALGRATECAPVGVINDNSTEVGKVHLGLAYTLRVDSLKFEVAEHGKHTAAWATKEGLEAHYDRMERWSQVLMDHVIRAS